MEIDVKQRATRSGPSAGCGRPAKHLALRNRAIVCKNSGNWLSDGDLGENPDATLEDRLAQEPRGKGPRTRPQEAPEHTHPPTHPP